MPVASTTLLTVPAFPAALEAFEDLDARDTLELLGKAPDPARAAKLTRAQVSAALKRRAAEERRRHLQTASISLLSVVRSLRRSVSAAERSSSLESAVIGRR